jgi:multiple sugar transport system ATP-binding protein
MELYARPANLFVAAFIGTPSMNFVRGVLRKSAHGDHLVESGAFMLDAPALGMSKLDELVGNNVILGIRPADIYDKNLSNGLESTEHNTLLADVDLVEPMGDVSAVYLSVGGSELVAMIDGVTAARTGEQLRIVVDVSRGHLFDPETERSVMSQESVL